MKKLGLDALTIDDDKSFRHVALYEDLKTVLKKHEYRFRVAPEPATWDRVVFLNLTFWSAAEEGDLLVIDHVAADVVAHVGWHHLAARALGAKSADAMFFGEAIASAFDLYLIGRALGHAPDCELLATQVPAMADVAEAAGFDDFEGELERIANAPEAAFEELRALLFDVTTALLPVTTIDEAATTLARFEGRRFAYLLHHYEVSNWLLYARAHSASRAPDAAVRALDAELRAAPDSLALLDARWVRPALG